MKTEYVAVLVSDPAAQNFILLQKGKGPEHLIGKWTAPGGKAESGETLEEAAVREFMEETGVTLNLKYLAPLYKFTAKDYSLTVFYTTTTAPESARMMETEAVAVFKLEDVNKLIENGIAVDEMPVWLKLVETMRGAKVFDPEVKAAMNDSDEMHRMGSGKYLPGMFMTVIGAEYPETGKGIGKVVRLLDGGLHGTLSGREGIFYDVEAFQGIEVSSNDGKTSEMVEPSADYVFHQDDLRPSTEAEVTAAWGDFEKYQHWYNCGKKRRPVYDEQQREIVLLQLHIARVSAELAHAKSLAGGL